VDEFATHVMGIQEFSIQQEQAIQELKKLRNLLQSLNKAKNIHNYKPKELI
jgi:hypothetical protein